MALLIALATTGGDIVIVTDNGHLDSPERADAYLRYRAREAMRARQGDAVPIWIRSHQTARDILDGNMSGSMAHGNAVADEPAGGAAWNVGFPPRVASSMP